MDNEIIKVENNELVITKEFIKSIKKDYSAKVRLDKNLEMLKELGRPLMEKYGINKIDNELFEMKIKEGHIRKVADTDKMKIDGIYDDYTKDVNVKPSVTINFK